MNTAAYHGEHPIKDQHDAEAFAKYWPGIRLDRRRNPANGCDASDTLSPPGVGGDMRPRTARR